MKALGTTLKRSPLLPDVPTIDSGRCQFEFGNWHGLFAPAGTPERFVRRLHAQIAYSTIKSGTGRGAATEIITRTLPEELPHR
jgi:tripartite-type tricarboxylate transporter receptor subunit TctC